MLRGRITVDLPRKWRHILRIFVVCLCVFWANNEWLPVDLMESRNLATAREMVDYGNWLVPTLNGDIRLEKPPLPTWCAAFVEWLSPHDICAQRGLVACVATLWTLFVYLLTYEISQKRILSLLTALAFSTSYSTMFLARNATWDVWCHAFLCVGLFFYVRAFKAQGKSLLLFLSAGLFFGLSFMSKGPISWYALGLPFLLAYHFVMRPSLRGKGWGIGLLLLIMVLVSFWWYIYLIIYASGDLNRIVHQETTAWVNRNVRPFWYYWSFFKETGIWCTFLVTAMLYTFFNKDLRKNKLQLFSALWVLCSLFLLSLTPEKKFRYLLPMMQPCALCVGTYFYGLLARENVQKSELLAYKINIWLVRIVIVGVMMALCVMTDKIPLSKSWGFLLVLAVILFTTFVLKLTPNLQHFRSIVVLMIGVSVLGLPLLQGVFSGEQREHSLHSLLQQTRNETTPLYYLPEEELRPQVMYSAGKRVFKLQEENHQMPVTHPYILLVQDTLLIAHEMNKQCLGRYDENWKRKGKHGYHTNLTGYAYLFP